MKREVGLAESVLIVAFSVAAYLGLAFIHPSDLTIAVAFLIGTVAEPALVLAHELGHAAAAVRVTGQRARVQAGRPPYTWVFSIGKVSVEYANRGIQGHCRFDRSAPMSGWGLLAIALAGPAVNIALALMLGGVVYLIWGTSQVVILSVVFIAGSSLFLGLANLIPQSDVPDWWPGAIESEVSLSDGYVALIALHAGVARTVLAPPPPRLYTPSAAQAIAAAGVAASAERSQDVDAQHLLVGLSRVERGGASRILRECGFEPPPSSPHAQSLPSVLTPAAQRALERAKVVLSLRGDPMIDTEHMLLGLVEDGDDSVTGALARGGADRAELRRRLLQALSAQPDSLPTG